MLLSTGGSYCGTFSCTYNCLNFYMLSNDLWKHYILPTVSPFFPRMTQPFVKLRQPSYINPYPTAFPYGNGMVLHFYQQQESSTTKTVHKVINKGLKTYV